MNSRKKITWGILAPGRIAHLFANDIMLSENSEILAVASRDEERANQFAKKYNIKETYNNYEDFYKNCNCDIVYIASPHVFHKEQVLACFNSGKSVICEKPVGVNAEEIIQIIETARRNDLFFMEAMWTRFFPVIEEIMAVIDSGKIGQISLVKADFCFRAKPDFQDRLYNPELGGGSLLDTGVYVIALAQMFMRSMPVEIKTQMVEAKTGVDGTASYIFKYEGNRMAQLSTSILTKTPNNAVICGDLGYIFIENFWAPDRAIIHYANGNEEIIQHNKTGRGYYYEILEVEKCIIEGRKESKKRTYQDTLDVLTIMDTIREGWSVKPD